MSMEQINFQKYKAIRNDIRQFSSLDLVLICINKSLEVFPKNSSEWVIPSANPWVLLLLIKWVLHESHFSKQKKPNYKDFVRIYNKINEFNDTINGSEEETFRIEKFMRKTAFQQFWLQPVSGLDHLKLSRIVELFLIQKEKYDLDGHLNTILGLSKKEIIDFSFWVWIFLGSQNSKMLNFPFLTTDFFSKIKDLDVKKLKIFLDLISIDWDEAVRLSTQASTERPLEYQKYEQTPFKHKPFLRTSKGLLCFHPRIWPSFLENFIYDFSKSSTGGAFNSKFGTDFEDYVGNSLSKITSHLLSEKQVKARFKCHKTVDYYVEHSLGNLLIECKAIEMGPVARVDPSDNILERTLRDSIIKSMAQSLDVIGSSKLNNKPATQNNFIFIVTFKELYLGDGQGAWDEFLRSAVSKYYPDLDISLIDPNKIFFVSVDDFDSIVAKYQDDVDGLFEQLNRIALLKLSPKERRYVSGMYFPKPSSEQVEKLGKNFKTYFDEWKSRLKD